MGRWQRCAVPQPRRRRSAPRHQILAKTLPQLKVVEPELPPPPVRDLRPTTTQAELHRAAQICSQAKEAVVSMFQEACMGKAVDAESASSLVQEISDSVTRKPGALISLARLKTADEYTYMHSVAVCA